ncbi:MAG TPA: hypothetical protein VF763_05185 [Candidatus Limnocylindrales bacterium]
MAILLVVAPLAPVAVPIAATSIAVVILARRFGRPQQPLVLPPAYWSVR